MKYIQWIATGDVFKFFITSLVANKVIRYDDVIYEVRNDEKIQGLDGALLRFENP